MRPIISNTAIDRMINQQNNTRAKVPAQSITSADDMVSNTNHYDDLLLNPPGSTSSDTAEKGADKVIKRKCPF